MKKLFTSVDYGTGELFKAIILGDGSTSIMDLKKDGNGCAGIAFKKHESGEVGVDSGDGGKCLSEVNPELIIITDNVESLKVLLDKVKRAIATLEGDDLSLQ